MKYNTLVLIIPIVVSLGMVFTTSIILSAAPVLGDTVCKNTKSGKITDGECPGKSEKSPNKKECNKNGPIIGCPADPV